jgi:phosphoglucosamine mutase
MQCRVVWERQGRRVSRRYFGTDGVRGEVGTYPLTVDFAMRLASATAQVLRLRGASVLIGRDTRESGAMFTAALQAGYTAAGVHVRLAGVVPTPAVSYLVSTSDARLGVVISASHNLYSDNGIKFFDAAGGKLDDDTERQIEEALDDSVITLASAELGTVTVVDDALDRYRDFCVSVLPPAVDLGRLKLVVDCAHGSAYSVAPQVFASFGVKDLVTLGTQPDGRNINDECGSTAPQQLQRSVLEHGADLGIGFDGDGDRLVLVDRDGNLIDGDQLLYVLACHRHEAGALTPAVVVGTVMTNMGLEEALAARGIELVRAKVGDRYVLELLNERGAQLGGENSGHVLCLDLLPTGDALVVAVLMLGIIGRTGRTITELTAGMPKYTQLLRSVRVPPTFDLTNEPDVQRVYQAALGTIGTDGRIVLRASGTEPCVRVMVEGRDGVLVERLVAELVEVIEAAC